MPTDTRSFQFTVSSPGGPSWWTALADKTWTAIAGGAGIGGTLDSVIPPGVGTDKSAYITQSWCGGVVCQNRKSIIFFGNGGHGNYSGNEVYEFSLVTLLWSRLTDPSAAAFDTVTSDGEAMRVDGTPTSTHSYSNDAATPDGRCYRLMMGSVNPSGHFSPACWKWDRNNFTVATGTRGWTYLGDTPTSATSCVGISGYDPIHNRILYSQIRQPTGGSNQQFGYVDLTNDSLHAFTTGAVGDMGLNPGGCVVYTSTESALLAGGASSRRTINGSTGAVASPGWIGTVPRLQDGIVFDPINNEIIAKNGGGTGLLVANMPSNIFTGPYSFTNVAANGGTLPGLVSPDNGIYGRFNIIYDMGDGRSCLTYVRSTAEPVYVYKLPVGGLLP